MRARGIPAPEALKHSCAKPRVTEVYTISWSLKKKVKEALSKERGTVYKEHGGKIRVCLVYPNTYTLGMSNLGFQTVYHLLNGPDYVVCERAFLPAKEDIEEFQRSSTPLFSYEGGTRLKDFDIVAFSVSFEEDFFNIPKILSLAGIGVFSKERDEGSPLVMAGGIGASLNPEPIADMMDLFLIGEGEGALKEFMDVYGAVKGSSGPRAEALKMLDSIKSVYVPSLYEFMYDGAKVKEIKASKGAKERVIASKNLSLDGYPIPRSFIITPDTEFKDTFLTEIERGCTRGCRFCAAGFLYLPPRWRDFNAVKDAVKSGLEATGKAGLVGAAVSEYPGIKELLDFGKKEHGTLTLSSLRMDALDKELISKLKDSGYKTVTLAPEAGSERMRFLVNKGIKDDEILDTIALISDAGFSRLKLYFMVGLPSESDDDARAIVELTLRIKALMKTGKVDISVNPFIPKSFTPFQWCAFEDTGVIENRLSIIKKGFLREPGVCVSAMPAKDAFVQAYLSRGDRRAGAYIVKGRRSIRRTDEFVRFSVFSERSKDEILPWDIIDYGVKKDYLWNEHQRGLKGKITAPCNVGNCFRCGVC